MIGKKLGGRIKATVLSAIMTATVFISPAAYQLTQVSAADVTVNHTFITTESTADNATNKKNIDVTGLKGATTVTFNFETTYAGEITIGVYGGGTSKAPDYWFNDEKQAKVTPKSGKFSFTYTIPTNYVSVITSVGIGIWYPKDGTSVKLTTISSSGAVTPPGPTEQDKPVSKNTKSGAYSFVDNKDGTATISSTLTAEIDDQEMDYLLTAGIDEESYLDETGMSSYQEGDLINSHKFKFSEFGLQDLSTVSIQSFNYTIKSDEAMSRFMYGGGINVEARSIADTEFVKGKNGYWYNDQGDEDMEEFGDLFEVAVNSGYTVTEAGDYVEVVWDVPTDVQPYVSKNVTDAVGFQFWYAQAADPGEEEYAEVGEVHLTAASCTYTRTMTVPYNKTATKSVNQTLTPGSDSTNQYKFNLNSLGLKNRDLVSAIKFTVSSSTDLTKFTGGVGISVGNENKNAKDGWFMPANITVLEPGKSFEIMWIVPDSIRKDVDILSDDGNLLFGAWYVGETAPSIILKSMDIYEFLSNEADLTVEPMQVNLAEGETKKLDINVNNCTFVSGNANVATVENDIVTAKHVGQTNVVVRTPEGQEVQIVVTVTPSTITTAITTAPPVTTSTTVITTVVPPTSTTSPVTTTVDPDDIIDWSRVKYGDVNLDEDVNIADIVKLNMYLLNKQTNPLNATARENANCVYDKNIDTGDSTLLMNYVAMMISIDKLGPQG